MPKSLHFSQTIVVVDRGPGAAAVCAMLAHLGHRPQHAAGAAEALRLMEALRAAYLLVDLDEAEGEGLLLCRVIKDWAGSAPVMAFALLAERRPGLDKRAARAGFDACLVRPLSWTDLRLLFGDARIPRTGA